MKWSRWAKQKDQSVPGVHILCPEKPPQHYVPISLGHSFSTICNFTRSRWIKLNGSSLTLRKSGGDCVPSCPVLILAGLLLNHHSQFKVAKTLEMHVSEDKTKWPRIKSKGRSKIIAEKHPSYSMGYEVQVGSPVQLWAESSQKFHGNFSPWGSSVCVFATFLTTEDTSSTLALAECVSSVLL